MFVILANAVDYRNKTEFRKGEIIMTKTIYVFRHGQTDYNVERRVMGQLDIPLNDVGHAQATELAEKLATASIGAVYSSPLARAMETARAVANKIGVPIITDARLMERNNGKLQGHIVHGTDNPAEYKMDYNQLELFFPASQLNDNNWRPDGGESRAECWARGQAAITDIAQTTPYDIIAVSTHSGIMRGILGLVGMGDAKIGNCDYVKLNWNGEKFSCQC